VVTDVEDLVQEIFLVAYRRFSAFDGRSPGSWLYQIMRRKVRDYWRSRWMTTVQLGNEKPGEAPTQEAGPEDALDTYEKSVALQRLLETLGEKERQALVLFELEGASGHKIAAIQGVPLNTVWARVRTARAYLKRRLGQLESEWVASGRPDPE
jgi:RNA polymerase sigma-70 factor (ECF subfamily)